MRSPRLVSQTADPDDPEVSTFKSDLTFSKHADLPLHRIGFHASPSVWHHDFEILDLGVKLSVSQTSQWCLVFAAHTGNQMLLVLCLHQGK